MLKEICLCVIILNFLNKYFGIYLPLPKSSENDYELYGHVVWHTVVQTDYSDNVWTEYCVETVNDVNYHIIPNDNVVLRKLSNSLVD